VTKIPVMLCPKDYWKKGAFLSVDGPIRGASLFLEHLMSGTVNEGTICKHHNRNASGIEIKNYLSKNSGLSENKKRIKVHDVGFDE
jgi:hypothetical protein